MKNKIHNSLPKKPEEIDNGGLYSQSVRCGKPTCVCAGGLLHEGYHYFIRRVNGRLTKTYVPKNQVADFRSLIDKAKLYRQIERDTNAKNKGLLMEFRNQLGG